MAGTVTQKTIAIEAVNARPKYPQFASGSVLADGKWLTVSKNVNIGQFQKQTVMTVDVETNAKGYESIVGISTGLATTPVASREVVATNVLAAQANFDAKDAAKARRIARQGSIQAAVQALALNVRPEELFVKSVELADQMIKYIEQ